MLFIPCILALALVTLDLREAGFILVVLDLMAGHSDLIASITSDWLVCAYFLMFLSLTDMEVFTTVVGTISKSLIARLLHMLLDLIEYELSLGAAIGALEYSLVKDGSYDEVQVALLAQLIIARVTGVSPIGTSRRLRIAAVSTGQPPA